MLSVATKVCWSPRVIGVHSVSPREGIQYMPMSSSYPALPASALVRLPFSLMVSVANVLPVCTLVCETKRTLVNVPTENHRGSPSIYTVLMAFAKARKSDSLSTAHVKNE